MAILLILGTSNAWAAPIVGVDGFYDLSIPEGQDEGTYYAYTVIDGVLWEIHRSESSTGTGSFDPFIRFDAGQDGIEEAYNTDAKPPEFDTKASPHTHSLTLADVPIATREVEPGIEYTGREFYIDINQSVATGFPLLYIDDYEFLLTRDPAILGYNSTGVGYASEWSSTNSEPEWVGEIDWNFYVPTYFHNDIDTDGPEPPAPEGTLDRQILMDYNVENGSGWGDYRVIILDDYFTAALARYNSRHGTSYG